MLNSTQGNWREYDLNQLELSPTQITLVRVLPKITDTELSQDQLIPSLKQIVCRYYVQLQSIAVECNRNWCWVQVTTDAEPSPQPIGAEFNPYVLTLSFNQTTRCWGVQD